MNHFSTDIKADFPIFNSSDLIYLDNASTTQKPSKVLKEIDSFYKETNANVHRAIYSIGNEATRRFESAREKVAKFINAPSSKEIVFTSGATESINLLARSLVSNLEPGDEILLSAMEHHSNIVPWQMMAEKFKVKIKYLPIDKIGELDLNNSEQYFTSRTKIVSITHISNVLGTINPIEDLAKMAHKVGALFISDGAQGVPHMQVDVAKLGCDFYAFSGHKMLGPTGIGVLWGKTKLLEELDPFMGGGEMIETVSFEESTWNEIPYKFEAGTPNIAQAVGLGAAVDYLDSIGMKNIQEHEKKLTDYAFDKIKDIEGIRIHGSSKKKSGVISFNIKDIHPQDLAQFLDQDNIAIRVGHHCAQPLLSLLNETSTARISFYIYNSEEDIDKFCDSMIKIKTYF
ncbi:MAG: aminotransferase class V-fold PLP-dependent enzyme [Fidelibacterota bacterium]|jgi:cysteine desulfurase/selenocysteine lyase|tara:strand:- start:2062 stop:3264 length:1203 start_codon:yes stop_codon:yes gene_type:complete